jgi:hypothetical protein
LAVDPRGESVNVNSLDEIPDSAWFINRLGQHPITEADLRRGACEPACILDAEATTEGS